MSVAWVGAAVGVAGVVSSSVNAGKAADAASDASDASIAFEQQKYDDWKATYGDLESNLSSYYNSLSADSYVSMGLENSQKAYETSMTRINESLAQRGITNTAVAASIGAQAELGQAENRALIRQEATDAVQQDKLGFLQIGLGQDPSASYSSTLANQASALQSSATQQQLAASTAISDTVSTGLKTWSDYYNQED